VSHAVHREPLGAPLATIGGSRRRAPAGK